MRCAICDDDKIFRDNLKCIIDTYSNIHRLEIVTDEYINGDHLLNSSEKYDMIFLDYKMDGIDGLETARILRKRDINCAIIFLTNYPYFVYESFEVNAFRFFEKPIDAGKLFLALDKYFEIYGNNLPLLFKIGRNNIVIKTNEIIYIEADNKKCYINLSGEKLSCARTMASVAMLIPNNIFYKVHKAFIVNFNYISNYTKESVYLANNDCVPISRKYFSFFKKAYTNYSKTKYI